MRSSRAGLAAALLLVAIGCSSNDHTTVDAAVAIDAPIDAPSATDFGMHMPRAIVGDPTDIMATPKIMAITWDNDPLRAGEEKFFTQYAASTAWAAQTAEYGVGPLTVAPPGHIAGNAPATITEAQALSILTANLTGSGSGSGSGSGGAWGAPDENTVYMFLIPVGTSFDDGTGAKTCSDYDGYHFDTTIGGKDIAYAISASCHAEATSLGITDLQDVGVTAGHELVEAVTDPRTANVAQIGWGQSDDDHIAWTIVTEGELGDLCEYAATEDWASPPGMDTSTQRTWSNAAAAAGHDPCVGEGTTPYYQAIPADPDAGTVSVFGNAVHTKGTKVAVNATGNIQLTVYSDVPTAGPFTIKLFDLDGTTASPLLTFVQPTGTYHVGDTVTVPVTVKATDPNVSGGEVYEVDLKPAGGGPTTAFYALVVQ